MPNKKPCNTREYETGSDELESGSEGGAVDEQYETAPIGNQAPLADVDIDEELQKARELIKSRKLKKEEEQLAKQIKRERLAKAKEYPPQPKKSGRYEKNSDEAKEWAKKMQEAKARKKQEREMENKKQTERETLTKSKIEEAQEAKIQALQRQIDLLNSQAINPKPIAKTKKPKVPINTPAPIESEDDSAFEEAKKIVRKKREKKAVANQHIESEKTRIENELYLQQMRSVIPNFGL